MEDPTLNGLLGPEPKKLRQSAEKVPASDRLDGNAAMRSMVGDIPEAIRFHQIAEEQSRVHVQRWLEDGMKAYWNDPVFHAKATLARQFLEQYEGWTLQHRAIALVRMVESITQRGEIRHG